MLTLIFILLFVWVLVQLIRLAVRAAWGVLKVLLFIILLPLILFMLAIAGMAVISLPILLVVGVAALLTKR